MSETAEPRFPDLDDLPLLGPPEVIPEGFEPVRFLPGQRNPPPKILWGDRFDPDHPECEPVEWQIERVKKVAAAMNHAAAHAQELLRQTIEIANHQEDLLRQWQERDATNGSVTASMIATMNAEKQSRLEEMQELRAELRTARQRLAAMEARDANDDGLGD